MFHTKICGVRKVADIEAVAASGADAIGLNFYPRSIRYVDPDAANTQDLSNSAQNAGLIRVGLFVNHCVEEILRIVHVLGLDMIQLHGDETVAMVTELVLRTDLPVIRAIKLPTGPLSVLTISDQTTPWEDVGCHLLLDADAGDNHGGSGQTIDWKTIRQWAENSSEMTWVLAGGLTPENIARAVLESGAKSVDTASGVERTRGEKSSQLIRKFSVERQKNSV